MHVLVTKEVLPENQEKWLKMARELEQATLQENGCISYIFVHSNELPTRFFIIEVWVSQGHLDKHMSTGHFKRLVPAMDAISSTPAIDLCTECLHSDAHVSKILVLYDSSTNCTEQMADLVAEGVKLVPQTEVRIRAVPGEANHWDRSSECRDTKHPIASFEDIYWADGIACGSPTNLGCISWRMKKFWDDFSQESTSGGWGTVDGKLACSFTSNGGAGGGGELANQAMNSILMNFGFTVFGITDYVSFKQTMHYGAVCAKAPREPNDSMPCIRQGTRLAEFVGLYLHGRKDLHPLRASKAVDIARWGHPGIPPREASLQELMEINKGPSGDYTHPDDSINRPEAAALSGGNSNRDRVKKVLIYTRMMDYVHGSTAAAAAWVQSACTELGWEAAISDDESLFSDPAKSKATASASDKQPPSRSPTTATNGVPLSSDDTSREREEGLVFDLIVLVNNSGEIFDPHPEHNLLSRHVAAGRGVLGIHAALACFLSDTDPTGATLMEPTVPIVESIFRAHFKNHPPVQTATVSVDAAAAQHIGLPGGAVPTQFSHTDEFFNYTRNPCNDADVTVLAYVDEGGYTGGLMGDQHPVVSVRLCLQLLLQSFTNLAACVAEAL